MKYRKSIIIATAIALVGITGVSLASTHTVAPKTASDNTQTASVPTTPAITQETTPVDSTTPVNPTPTTTDPVVQPTDPKTEAFAIVDQVAIDKDWAAQGTSIDTQKTCLDDLITNSIGWSDSRVIQFTKDVTASYISYCAADSEVIHKDYKSRPTYIPSPLQSYFL